MTRLGDVGIIERPHLQLCCLFEVCMLTGVAGFLGGVLHGGRVLGGSLGLDLSAAVCATRGQCALQRQASE